MNSDNHLEVYLRRGSAPLAQPHLVIEDSNSLAVQTPHEFRIKFREFIDQLDHLKFIEALRFHAGDDLSSEEKTRVQIYQSIATDVIENLKGSIGNREDSLMGLENIFANLPTILAHPSIEDLQILPKEFSAVVISAGPSRALEIETLKRIQNSALLIAVDAVLEPLLNEGIIPHLVVSTERFNDVLPFFDHLPTDPLKTILVGQSTIPPAVFERFPGKKLTAAKFIGPSLWLPLQQNHEWAGSCVSHLGFSIAARLGAQSIALVGQDLSYHPDTFASHAPVGHYHHWTDARSAEQLLEDGRHSWQVGNTRERVLTHLDWQMFAHEFQVLVAQKKIPTVNTSTLGLKIEGLPYQSLSEWAAQTLKSEAEVAAEICDRDDRLEADRERVLSKMSDALQEFSRLQAAITSGQSLDTTYANLRTWPHFLELLLEPIFSEFIRMEQALFHRPEQIAQRQAYFFGGLLHILPRISAAITKAQAALQSRSKNKS